MFTDEDYQKADKMPELGPAYFAARRFVEKAMQGADEEPFKPLIDKIASDIRDKLWDDVQNFLMSDTEYNVQGAIWRAVDDSVDALLAGKEWAIKKYVLADRYDAIKVRETVAKHITDELYAARIKDLEKEVADLKYSLELRNKY